MLQRLPFASGQNRKGIPAIVRRGGEFYRRPSAKDKPAKVALVARMPKLVPAVNGRVRDQLAATAMTLVSFYGSTAHSCPSRLAMLQARRTHPRAEPLAPGAACDRRSSESRAWRYATAGREEAVTIIPQ